MTTHYLGIGVRALGLPEGREGNDAFDEQLDCLVEKFAEIGYDDADYAASLTKREAEFILRVDAADFETAVITAMGDLRTALHAAECATPDWPDLQTLTESIRRVSPDRDDDGDHSGRRELADA